MNYLLIDKLACQEIVQNRFLQNIGFPPAQDLISLLKGNICEIQGLSISYQTHGLLITKQDAAPNEDAIVLDLEAMKLFEVVEGNDSDALISIQKTLRFCIKYWESLAFSTSEIFVKGSTKAVVFPFSFQANGTNIRVTLEREPYAKRLARRTTGRYLLAYKFGKTEGDGNAEEASLTNFKKAYDDFNQLIDQKKLLKQESKNVNSLASLNITSLHTPSNDVVPHQGYERWMHLLTDEQKAFVLSDSEIPHRLEGPAGTGKTLCLVLKAINLLKACEEAGEKKSILFVVPSDELAATIRDRFVGNGCGDALVDSIKDYTDKLQTVTIMTLQSLCAQLLNYEIDESELLDRDSIESKNTQLLYLDQIVSEIKQRDISAVANHISQKLYEFLSQEETWAIAQLLQHEISIVIKGKANGNLDLYKQIPSLDYGFPLETSQDKEYIFHKFQKYQSSLETSNQYDVDDIVISAIGQLDTPIWRRRRQQLGYDSIFIDEVHLFNLNEVSILHYLTKSPASVPISYSIDRSQAVGDIGWNDREFYDALGGKGDTIGEKNSISAVFRSSPQIIELAFCVTASGANLFTNFENPLLSATQTFTAEEERKSSTPCVQYILDDRDITSELDRQIEQMAKSLQEAKSNILIVVFDDQLLLRVKEHWEKSKKSFKYLEKRGDFFAISEANKAGCPVISSPEMVGGLEFSGVILLGCERGRLPPAGGISSFGKAYLNYRAHNNLYVAVTRAKYQVRFIVNKNRGVSDLLDRAIQTKLLDSCSEG